MAKKEEKEDQVFSIIKNIYFRLDKDYEKLEALCKTDAEKKMLKNDYVIARANYRKSMNLDFSVNDKAVKDMIKELKKLDERITKDIENMDKISAVFKIISEAVKMASSIIVVVMNLL